MKTISISEDDLRQLLSEKYNLEKQVTELQNSNTEMLSDLRELTSKVMTLVESSNDDEAGDEKSRADLIRRADLCVKVIGLIMTTSSKGNDKLIEDISVEMMHLPEKSVRQMYRLLTMDDAFPSYDSGLTQYDLDCMKSAKTPGYWVEKSVKEGDDFFPDYGGRDNGR